MSRLHKVRVVAYARNIAGRECPYTKAGRVDLDQVEYMEEDYIRELGDCVILRLVSGKEFTIVSTMAELSQAMGIEERR